MDTDRRFVNISYGRNALVTVIMASYNHALFVSQAISSVLNQDVQNIELIVIDDGSTDGTPDILSKIKDPRVKVILNRENRRVHPRNQALEMAAGEFVAFQNSDDVWLDGKLSTQLAVLNNDPNIVACFTGVEIINAHGKQTLKSYLNKLFTLRNRSASEWLRHFFDHGNCLCLPSSLVRRSAITTVGNFRPSLIQLSDLDLWIRLAAIGNLFIVNKPLIQMRDLEKRNLSAPTEESRRRSRWEFTNILKRYVESPVREQIKTAFYDVIPSQARTSAAILTGLANYAWKHGGTPYELFADYVIESILDNPSERAEAIESFGIQFLQKFIQKRGRFCFSLCK